MVDIWVLQPIITFVVKAAVTRSCIESKRYLQVRGYTRTYTQDFPSGDLGHVGVFVMEVTQLT